MDCNFSCKYLEKCGFCRLDGGECDHDSCTLVMDCENCQEYENCFEQ